ncbi:response regulator [Halodesulfovibrio marinisediminis]|uniref:Two-component system, OmpR family, response regulator n=1 Tax=Halodesulfovibrio marinisediminis DSM 17456 TaxID=1121457 RepID=A0A1N6E818_9BACT|nr:response regulator transcription factor [Halodesulfovibrio marinisediminis]SIN79195.1 two-component system, OmpR family, response regulator [Halodesulfovibrio marinisediminis DSM 17456]
MRILLVEDDQTIANYIVKGLQEAGFCVEHASNGKEGLHFAVNETFDAAIFDLMLPELDGLSIIAEMRGKGIATPVLILSARQSVDDKISGLQTGADDYLTKPFSFAELQVRVQALIRRSSATPASSVLEVGDLKLDRFTREVQHAGQQIMLQAKEYALLVYLMSNAGRVVTKTMILDHIWEYSFDPQTNVVEVLVHRLRNKVDKPFGTNLIRTIRGVGYVLSAQ